MIIYPVLIAVMIGCSISETNCGLTDPPKKEFYSAEVLEEMGVLPIYSEGDQYIPVNYLKAVKVKEVKGPVQPFWFTRSYGVLPTHNYPYEQDATVYFSKSANKYGVLNDEQKLETKEMEVLDLD